MCMYTWDMCTPNQRAVHDFHPHLYVRCIYVHVYIIYAYIFVHIYCIHTQPARSAPWLTSTCVYMVDMYYIQWYTWIRLHSYKLHLRAEHCYHWHILYICIHICYFQWFIFLYYIQTQPVHCALYHSHLCVNGIYEYISIIYNPRQCAVHLYPLAPVHV